ncbi:MAG: hypothetical protein K0R17_52 [Rariglobus sp.]|nr:hypothetical protein [Rariglobus sp.]
MLSSSAAAAGFFAQPGPGGTGNFPASTSFKFSDGDANYIFGGSSYLPGNYTGATPFILSDGGNASFSFYSESPSFTDYGYFTLRDNGTFDFGMYADAMLRMDTDQSGFVFTLSGLITQPGTMISGFSVNGPSTAFFEALDFTFVGETGTVFISYDHAAFNLPAAYYSFSGQFTSSAVPEPATVALGLAAAAGVFVAWRRRKTPAV